MERKSLNGRKIVVTRSSTQASDLTRSLLAEGAIVFAIPAIEIVERKEGILRLKQELEKVSQYSWLILTSVNTVKMLDRILRENDKNWDALSSLKIACIGTATAQAVKNFGGTVSLVPPLFQAESLVDELKKQDLTGSRVLLPRAAGSRPVLPNELHKVGAHVEEIHVYEADLPAESRNELHHLLQTEKIDALTFTSSSTVRNFAEIAGELPWQQIPVACIGPITAQTLREHGVQPAVEAEEFTIPGLVAALKLYFGSAK